MQGSPAYLLIRRLLSVFRFTPESNGRGSGPSGMRRVNSELTQAERDAAHKKVTGKKKSPHQPYPSLNPQPSRIAHVFPLLFSLRLQLLLMFNEITYSFFIYSTLPVGAPTPTALVFVNIVLQAQRTDATTFHWIRMARTSLLLDRLHPGSGVNLGEGLWWSRGRKHNTSLTQRPPQIVPSRKVLSFHHLLPLLLSSLSPTHTHS